MRQLNNFREILTKVVVSSFVCSSLMLSAIVGGTSSSFATTIGATTPVACFKLLESVSSQNERAFIQANVPRSILLSPTNYELNQKRIIDFARQHDLPAFIITLAAGKNVPVVLLNKATIGAWSPVLQQTVGLNQSLNPGNGANHGYVRLPGRVDFDKDNGLPGDLFHGGVPEGTLVDLYIPYQSQGQAINGNGYKWKLLSEYFKRRNQGSFVHIEQVFAFSVEDQIKLWLYQSVKRSAIVRIQYMFDQHNNDWIRGQRRVLQMDGEFNHRRYTEHCNNCRIGETAPNQVQEMRGRLVFHLNADVDLIYAKPETVKFLLEAKRMLLHRDWRSEKQFSPDMLNKEYLLKPMRKYFREGLSPEQQVDALNYLLAVRVFEEVVELKQRYGIEEEVQMNFGNPRLSALFVYSDLDDSPGLFRQGQFEYFGANGAGFSSWWFGLNPRPIK